LDELALSAHIGSWWQNVKDWLNQLIIIMNHPAQGAPGGSADHIYRESFTIRLSALELIAA
jgi:hypothetical protein